MNWRLWTWKDIGAFVLVICLIAGLLLVWFASINRSPKYSNFGFGPEWDCRPVPNGEPICVKKPGH